ncbi:hypothetical protein IT575_07910 [bacterium]|nr:hypothetical protein [bacterium]
MDIGANENTLSVREGHALLLNIRDQLDRQQQYFNPRLSALFATLFLGGGTIRGFSWLIFGRPLHNDVDESWWWELLWRFVGLGILTLFWLLILRIKQHTVLHETEYLSRQLADLPLDFASRAAFHWSVWDSRRSAGKLQPALSLPRSGWNACIDGIKRDYFQAVKEAGRPPWRHAWTRSANFILPALAVLSVFSSWLLYDHVGQTIEDRLFSLTALCLTLWILIWAVFQDVRRHALDWALLQRVNLALSQFPAPAPVDSVAPTEAAGQPG